jgi:hypothetical protein
MMAQQPSGSSVTSSPRSERERIELALDGAMIEASRITREQLARAPAGLVIAWRLSVLCARILRGTSAAVSGDEDLVCAISEQDESAVNQLYRSWSDLVVGQADVIRDLWNDAKAGYERMVRECNAPADTATAPSESDDKGIIETFSDTTADFVVRTLSKANRLMSKGVGEATASYYAMKSEAFDWVAAAVIVFVAYGWAKR